MQIPEVMTTRRAQGEIVVYEGEGLQPDMYVMTEEESNTWSASEGEEYDAVCATIETALRAHGTRHAEVCLADGQLVMEYYFVMKSL